MPSSIDKLEKILQETNSVSRIDPERIAQSFYYDPTYSFALIACILYESGKVSENGSITINSTMVRFFHFCIIRPSLIENLKKWSVQEPQRLLQLDDFVLLPHAYLLDKTSLDSIMFLLSSGNLQRASSSQLNLNINDEGLLLNRIYKTIIEENLLIDERRNLKIIKDLKISLKDLGVAV